MEPALQQTSYPRPRFSRAALAALIMSVVALLTWFLPSEKAHSVGLAILFVSAVLILLNGLLFWLTARAKPGGRIAVRILAALFSLVVLLSVTVYTLAPGMLFYPHFDEESAHALAAYPEAEELTFEIDGRVVSGWMLHQVEGKAPLVLYFGGNGENASARVLRLIESGTQSAFSGCNFAFLDYPGYGKSSGSPSEASIQQMGLDVYDALAAREDVDASRIVLFGYSLGTGVANYVASCRPAAGLMLMAPYADGFDLYNSMVPIFYGPLRALVAFRMESVRFAEEITLKPLVVASLDDGTVPFASSERLAEAYPAGCNFVRMEGLGHNDFWGSDEVLLRISAYIAEVTKHGA
jgi:pimeloyl-ACP methyl ester carboxylesterase